MRVKELIEQINKSGPDRILINDFGDATSPKRTNIKPDIIFIRKDSWTLGAPYHLVPLAFGMWEDEWEFILFPPEKILGVEEFVSLMDNLLSIVDESKLN